MHFQLHQIRSHELIRESDGYRIARQARRATAVSTSQPTPRRLPAWLRGVNDHAAYG